MNYRSLHEEALRRVKDFNHSTVKLLEVLEQIDNSKSYLKLKYSSLWSYVTVGLKLSESQAQQFISVMRKSKDIPALKAAVATGTVSLPKAALIVSEIAEHNQKEWIEKASRLTTLNLKEELAKANPKPIPMERITVCTEEYSELKLALKKEVLENLKRVQDLLSQKKKSTIKLNEAIEEIVAFYLEKNCPLKKAERALCTNKVKVTPVEQGRIVLPTWVKHQVHKTCQSRCMALLPNGHRCESKRFLEIHHKIPLSLGGSNQPENLLLLCSGHHKGWHLANAG